MDYIAVSVDGGPKMVAVAVPMSTKFDNNDTFTLPQWQAPALVYKMPKPFEFLPEFPVAKLGLIGTENYKFEKGRSIYVSTLADIQRYLPGSRFIVFAADMDFARHPIVSPPTDSGTPTLVKLDRVDWTFTTLRNWDKLPLALSNAGGCTPAQALPPTSSSGSSATAFPPSPGYWPVRDIFINKSQSGLAQLLADSKLPVRICEGAGLGTFLRDAFLSVYRDTSGTLSEESWQTTLGSVNIQKIDGVAAKGPATLDLKLPPGAKGSPYGYGGNFLTVERTSLPPCLFYGRSALQVGDRFDDVSMIDAILYAQKTSVQPVGVETGWLKVGHVDEIMSFPKRDHALLASPALYKQIVQQTLPSVALADATLNDRVETLMTGIETLMVKTLGLHVLRLPVWFKPSSIDPMHVTTVRGNAINCIYDSASGRSFHAGSGPANSTAIDDAVSKAMSTLGYAAHFADMSAANNEGGGGGNVHCVTYTRHTKPT